MTSPEILPTQREKGSEAGPSGYSFVGLIAPVLAGFSLPAIIVFASNTYPGQPSHGIILSLLVVATGLFLASIQLTSPLIDERFAFAGPLRRALTTIGISVIGVAIILLGEPAMHEWYGITALIAVFTGSVGPASWLAVLWLRGAGKEGASQSVADRDSGELSSLHG
jgi:hypothetical protein